MDVIIGRILMGSQEKSKNNTKGRSNWNNINATTKNCKNNTNGRNDWKNISAIKKKL